MPHSKDWVKTQTVKRGYELNTEFPHVMETYHTGPLPQIQNNIKISSDSIIATVLKQSENGHGLILRLYEIQGVTIDTEIELPFLNRKWHVHFGPCEIKTFFIPHNQKDKIQEVGLTEL